ncbi:MAG: ArnT family glycosyltransferase, partial [Gemmatimonadaceae bacterium]
MSATPTRATPTKLAPIRGPSDNHPAVQLDRVQRLVAGTFTERGVLVLAFGALLLRISTLTWGAGVGEYDGFYHPDESKAWRSTQGFPENYLSNSNYLYGTAVQYVIGLLLLPVKLAWQAGHPFFPSLAYTEFVVLAVRAVHALLGSLTVVLVFWLGKIVFDRTAALIAALLLAVSFHHALNSAFATLDVPMSFLVTLVLVLAARAVTARRLRDFLFLGVATGALFGTKLNGAVIVVPLAVLFALSLAARPEA